MRRVSNVYDLRRWRPAAAHLETPMSEFAFLFRGRNRQTPPDQQQATIQKWGAWFKALNERGVITNPGQPLAAGGRIVEGQGKAVNDGPFAEIKDLVNGFIIVEAADLDAAAEIARGCPILDDDGSVEVRPVLVFNP
jgi:hypothetical protein